MNISKQELRVWLEHDNNTLFLDDRIKLSSIVDDGESIMLCFIDDQEEYNIEVPTTITTHKNRISWYDPVYDDVWTLYAYTMTPHMFC